MQQSRHQRRQAELIGAEGARQGVFFELLHQVGAADDDAGLRPAQQLISRETHQVGASRQRFLDGRLMAQPVAGRIEQSARAQVINQGDSGGMGDSKRSPPAPAPR